VLDPQRCVLVVLSFAMFARDEQQRIAVNLKATEIIAGALGLQRG
jgi:hypothetical protein